jgi:A/G-specific adenine glycosylase
MTATSLQTRLLAHYDRHRRPLPWRADTDPYRVWISEVMLQQTRVDTVVPYYARWLEQFPSVSALADAPLENVLKAWEGLGYYSRARNLHSAARLVCEHHSGQLPANARSLCTLPGFGEYTSGAVASIAFGERTPAVDGNVRRVLSRIYDLPDPGSADIRAHADALIPADRPGDFNQALMDLGATICTPRAPSCRACPIATHCLAFQRGTQAERPLRKARARVSLELVGTLILTAPSGRVLLARRPEQGLLGGLWELPGAVVQSRESARSAARRLLVKLLGEASMEALVPRARVSALGSVVHVFTHKRATYHAFAANAAGELDVEDHTVQHRWCTEEDIAALAIPVAQRKLLALRRT